MIQKIQNRYRKVLQNEQGLTAVEIAIGLLLTVFCIALFTDLIVIGWKNQIAAQVATRVARNAGLQGGFLHAAPPGFPGEDESYTDTEELKLLLTEQFKSAGIKPEEWSVTVYSANNTNNKTVYTYQSSPETPEFDYGTPIIIETRLGYSWDMTRTIIPGNPTGTIFSRRATVSEWKHDYSDWE